jgi:hypothetical protein
MRLKWLFIGIKKETRGEKVCSVKITTANNNPGTPSLKQPTLLMVQPINRQP